MTVDLDKLEALARAATPGPWRECGADRGGCICGLVWSIPADVSLLITHRPDGGEEVNSEHNANTRFIAAANPSTILALIERLRRLEKWLETAKAAGGHEQTVARVLATKVERYEKALAHYADVNNWYGEKGDRYVAARFAEPGTLLTYDAQGDGDGPSVARAALRGEGEG